MGLLLLTSAQQSAADTGSLYQQALSAFEMRQWRAADSLATLALGEIDSVERTDWTYTGGGEPHRAAFFGDFIMMIVVEKSTDRKSLEIYDPRSNELVHRYDVAPWRISNNYFRGTENYIFGR